MKPYPHCINSPDEKYTFEPEQFCFNLTDLNLSDVIKKEIEISAKVLLIKGKQWNYCITAGVGENKLRDIQHFDPWAYWYELKEDVHTAT